MNRLISIIILFNFFSIVLYTQELPPIKIMYSSYAFDAKGKIIGYFNEKKRVEVKNISQISKNVIDCLIATEDREFYNHDGVSVRGLLRAAWQTIIGKTQGGSTLTMQLARNLFLSQEKSLNRKVKEIELAKEFEKKFNKNDILLMYLNYMYFGHGAYGIFAASNEIFNKDPKYLTITEAATLVGLLQAPGAYDPVKHPEKTLKRRNEVLYNLVEVKKLSLKEFEKLKNKPLGLDIKTFNAMHFIEYLKNKCNEILWQLGKNLSMPNIRVETTLNPFFQSAAETIIKKQWESFPNSMKNAQVGFISLEAGSGKILTMIGGNNNSKPGDLDHVTQIKRQPGSAFKPFLYGKLIEDDFTAALPLKDSAIVFDEGKSFEWRPTNDEEKFTGKWMTMKNALCHSVNLASAYGLKNYSSPDSVINFAKKCGIKSKLINVPSIILGASETTPLEMATAYSTFANSGIYYEPYCIEKIYDGETLIYSHQSNYQQVIDSTTAYIITDMLRSVVDSGTAYRIKDYYKHPAAGKTGTTQNFTDAWFVGYTPKITTAIWVGFDDSRKKLNSGYGYSATVAVPLWGSYMKSITNKKEVQNLDFYRPSSIEYEFLCEDDGKFYFDSCNNKNIYPVDITKIKKYKSKLDRVNSLNNIINWD